jgi:predicted dehydrogenase
MADPIPPLMKNRLRLALIGGGLITQSAHLPSALGCGDFEVAALVDPVLERVETLARSYGIRPLLAADVEQVLARIDAAVIATPNHTHAPIAVRCLEAGVPVLIEKPLASTAAEGRAILAAAARRSTLVAPGYVTRFRGNVRLLKRLLADGRFGEVRRFVHQFGTAGGWAPLSGYNLRRDAAGGGVLMVTATHFLDRMLFLWGMPAEVEYEDDARGGPEANCVARFRFASGLWGEARYSKTTALPGGLAIDTDRGTVVLGDTDSAEIHLHPRERPDIVEVLRPAESDAGRNDSTFLAQMSAFAAACRGDAVFPVPAEQAVQSLELIERLYGCRRLIADGWYEASA